MYTLPNEYFFFSFHLQCIALPTVSAYHFRIIENFTYISPYAAVVPSSKGRYSILLPLYRLPFIINRHTRTSTVSVIDDLKTLRLIISSLVTGILMIIFVSWIITSSSPSLCGVGVPWARPSPSGGSAGELWSHLSDSMMSFLAEGSYVTAALFLLPPALNLWTSEARLCESPLYITQYILLSPSIGQRK